MLFTLLAAFLPRAAFVLGASILLRRSVGNRLSAASRYRLTFASLASLPILAILPSLDRVRGLEKGGGGVAVALGPIFEERFVFAPADGSTPGASPINVPDGIARALVAAWAAATIFYLVKTAALRISTALELRGLGDRVDGPWIEALDGARAKLGLSLCPELRQGPFASPFVAGLARQIIVLPRDSAGWTAERREAAMMHELGHIIRRDALLMTAAEILAAPARSIPFTRMLLDALAEDREEACDAMVIRAGTRPSEYASLILDLASSRHPLVSLGVVGGKNLGDRIRLIIDGGSRLADEGTGTRKKLAAALLLAFVAAASVFPVVFTVDNGKSGADVRLRRLVDGVGVDVATFRSSELPWGRPLDGEWRVTLPFGIVEDPLTGGTYFHAGLDLSNARSGDAVQATMDGVVIDAGSDPGRGNYVAIGRGATIAAYYHLSSIRATAGQQVSQGDTIGAVGDSGRSTGPHLHYEVRVDGAAVDPAGLLADYVKSPGHDAPGKGGQR